MMVSMGARLALTLAVLSALGGCAAILGVDDLTYLGPEGGLDAASEASGDAGDAGAQDAPCEAAVATDPKNCGGCGRDCLGGGCEAGVCQPVLVTTGSGLVTLASDGTTLFLRDSAAIHACPVTGCADAGTPLS